MKKCMAAGLAVCLFVQVLSGPVLQVRGADASEAPREETAPAVTETEPEEIVPLAGELPPEPETKGALEVELISGLPFLSDGGMKAAVAIDGPVKKHGEVTVSGTDPASGLVRFDDVPEGSYTVTAKADTFADYTQKVDVAAGQVSKIQVYSAYMETGSRAKPGWMLLGDVTGDGRVSDADTEAMLKAIRRNSRDSRYDLNRDGLVDIADLQYIVRSLGEGQTSMVERLAIPKGITGIQGTKVAGGKLDDLLNSRGSVSLRTADGGGISAANPVGMTFELERADRTVPEIEGIAIRAPLPEGGTKEGPAYSNITGGEVEITYLDNGTELTRTVTVNVDGTKGSASVKAVSLGASMGLARLFGLFNVHAADIVPTVTVDGSGMLILDLGAQVAVKRVTIRITGTRKKEQPLAEIAKVEFVNDMASRIPAPRLDVPEIETVTSGNKMLTVSWSRQNNITGYDVSVTGPDGKEQITRVGNTTHMISSINGSKLKNFVEYKIRVRSVNGDWKSPWSAARTAVPEPQSLPAPPDYVQVTGGYLSLTVSWKAMDDADGYMVYYKKTPEKDFRPAVSGFTPVQAGTGKLSGTSYVITGLEEGVSYSVCVIGWNRLGWGRPSLTATGTVKSARPPLVPKYKLLNTSNGAGQLTAHITAATMGGHGGAAMVGSALDDGKKNSALGVVDDSYVSYWSKTDWDDGVAYPANDRGMTITLDDAYKMNYLTFGAADEGTGLETVRIDYWDSEAPEQKKNVGARLLRKQDANNNSYYIVKLDEAVTADRIQISLGRSYTRAEMKVAEVHFHQYDDLEERIMGLYGDAMHSALNDGVTEADIQKLEAELETTDPASGEKHPLYDELKLELAAAREILAKNMPPAYEVHSRITAAKDGHLGFGGLNAWQPLGKTAYAGETLLVYVGHNTKSIGASAGLQLVFTQQHAEAGMFARTVNLKVGRNSVTVPRIGSTDTERGGQIYVAYTGNSDSDRYAVRIAGGSDIPVLDLYGKTGAGRTAAIRAYVEKLEAYVGGIENSHNQAAHKDHRSNGTNKEYDAKNCILNATDIMLEPMMYSLPATQVWSGIAGASDKTTKLDNALKAMENTMTLFYQHKGLSGGAGTARGNNALPARHLNIRYMRMFAGAFMYASGNHIGVEWGSAPLASAPSDWNGFGWGVAHEIGHNINQGAYAVAEITNNYFAQLLTIDGKGTRFRYPDVYEKVTSGTVGRSPNGSTQLAMYWQLHLAYDNNKEDRHIYDSYEDQFANLFFARVDTYARNPASAPQAGLKLDGGVDQNLMRLSCAAADKNILPFFERWGMVPDEATKAYAAKYGEPETKALYYVNDTVRDYRVDHPETESAAVTGKNVVASAKAVAVPDSNTVNITITADAAYKDVLHGCEIVRKMTGNGRTESRAVGFIEADAEGNAVFTDTVAAINNRVISYEVRAVDKYLNYSAAKDAGSVKLRTDGRLDKSQWTVETENLEAGEDTVLIPGGSGAADSTWDTEEDPDSGYHEEDPSQVPAGTKRTARNMIDGKADTVYTAARTAGADKAVITIDLRRTEQVTALKYRGSDLGSLDVAVSGDGSSWQTVKSGYTACKGYTAAYGTVWFDAVEEAARENWIGTYDARYVRLTIAGTPDVAINELEICGPSGDNLEFRTAENGRTAIGVLAENYTYGHEPADVIPKGSLVFTGSYKGNPAYNVVIVYDDKGNVIGSTDKQGVLEAKQVILAPDPKDGNLGETSDGTWIYYLEPGKWSPEKMKGLKVRAELYRVDNARTLEGERVVSDTQAVTVPDPLGEITLTGSTQ